MMNMRFRATPFKHPEYSALQERSESLASLWAIGHIVFVLFLVLTFTIPLGAVMVMMIGPEVSRERVWSAIEAGVGAALLFAAIGFAVKRYASRKGRSMETPAGLQAKNPGSRGNPLDEQG